MAGSYNHIDDEGVFSMDTIDNMGDASEALHQCYFMIRFLAEDDPKRIAVAVEHYYANLRGETDAASVLYERCFDDGYGGEDYVDDEDADDDDDGGASSSSWP